MREIDSEDKDRLMISINMNSPLSKINNILIVMWSISKTFLIKNYWSKKKNFILNAISPESKNRTYLWYNLKYSMNKPMGEIVKCIINIDQHYFLKNYED